MPTSKQLRAVVAKLRKEGHDEAASHLDTHADLIDKAAAHAKLDRHIAKLDDNDLAKFNRSDALEGDELALVQTEINVAPLLDGARALITGDSPAQTEALKLLDITAAAEVDAS